MEEQRIQEREISEADRVSDPRDQIPGAEVVVNSLTQQPIANEQLSRISEIAFNMVQSGLRVSKLEAELAEESAKYRTLEMETLPNAMQEVGLESFTLVGGVKLKVKPFYSASIPPMDGKSADPSRRLKCFAWLRENNFNALIKTEVKAAFGKGDEVAVAVAVTALKNAGVPFTQNDSVHHMTLKAFVKEQCEAGSPPPEDLFHTFQGKQAVIEK